VIAGTTWCRPGSSSPLPRGSGLAPIFSVDTDRGSATPLKRLPYSAQSSHAWNASLIHNGGVATANEEPHPELNRLLTVRVTKKILGISDSIARRLIQKGMLDAVQST